MLSRLFRRKPATPVQASLRPKKKQRYEYTEDSLPEFDVNLSHAKTFQIDPLAPRNAAMRAMDSTCSNVPYQHSGSIMGGLQYDWFASQGFIGYTACAFLSQHWLIMKCCEMPAEDAVRNGYKVSVNDGTEVPVEVLDAIKKADEEEFNINKNLVEFVRDGKIYGIRVAMFVVDSTDDKYYEKPFNPDGVEPGGYRGISQVDPCWISPELSMEAASNPAAKDFYEPTWWRIDGKRYHRSHLVIFKTGEVVDLLKPTYWYGGVPIPQKVYQRVYASERVADEAPKLAMAKRTRVLKADLSKAAANGSNFVSRMQKWVYDQTNYSVNVVGRDDDVLQFDTSLADFDSLTGSQYQLVAAVANVPAVKLLGTTPKGFNTTGESEEAMYHEELKSIQNNDLTKLLARHHLLLIRSKIAPEFNIKPFDTSIVWNPLDEMTAKEKAEVNKIKAETGQVLITNGAIDGAEERQRITNDPESGYDGLDGDLPELDDEIIEE